MRTDGAGVVMRFADSTFLVECFWPDLSQEQVQRADQRLAECVAESRRAGSQVAYVGSIVLTGDDVIFFLFEASSPAEVRRICDQAQLQIERVVGSVVSARH